MLKTDVGKNAWGGVGKTNVWKSAWWTAWKTDVVKSAWRCVWKTNDCILGTWSHFSEKANLTLVVPFRSHFDELSQFVRFNACWQNVAIYALWLILVKCCDLRALTHVGKMSRFTHFARHKISAARRFQLFCTPDDRNTLPGITKQESNPACSTHSESQ